MTDDPAEPSNPSPSLAALVARAERAGRGAPPVDLWNPPSCGEIDIEIRADGTWFHEGSPIGREQLVRLFATVLRKDEDGRTYLVTPAEKLGIRVVDAPFVAVEMSRDEAKGEPSITFRTNVGDLVRADGAHSLRFANGIEGAAFEPYLLVRGRLEAKLTRSLAFDLVDFIEEDADGAFVRSGGARFRIPIGN